MSARPLSFNDKGADSTLLAVDKSHDCGVIGFRERVLLSNVHNKRMCHAHSRSMG